MKNDLYRIELRRLADSPTQPRSTYAGLDELADSIRKDGVLQPIIVRPLTQQNICADPEQDLEIVAGHRRVRAARLADLDDIPAMIGPLTDLEVVRIQAAENMQRDDMSPLDEATAIKHLIEMGQRAPDIARDLGLSERYVYARLALLKLTGKAREALVNGMIGVELAVLITQHSPVLHDKALGLITPGGEALSLRKAREALRANNLTHDLIKSPFPLTLMLDTAVACSACSLNSNNMGDQALEQLGGDRCTDPTCYRSKCRAHVEALLSKRQAQGWTVLEESPPVSQLGVPIQQAQESIDKAIALDPSHIALCTAWITQHDTLAEWLLTDGMNRLRDILTPTADDTTTEGEGGEEETSVATARDRSQEEPVTLPPTGEAGEWDALQSQIARAVLRGDAWPPGNTEMMLVCAALAHTASGFALALAGLPPAGSHMNRILDEVNRWPVNRVALTCSALAIMAVTYKLPKDQQISLLTQLHTRIVGAGAQTSHGSAVETQDDPSLAAGEEVMDEASLPAGAPSDGSTPEDIFAAAHAAGIADLKRGTRSYDNAKLDANVHPDSQQEHDWDTGYRAGQMALSDLCQQAEEAGRLLAVQGVERMGPAWKDKLHSLTGTRYIRGPIAAAFENGFDTAKIGREGKVKVKFRHPETGSTWTGRGLKPRWLVEAIQNGAKLESFEVPA